MKKFLGIAATSVLALSLLPAPAHAADFDDTLHLVKNINAGVKSSTPSPTKEDSAALGSKVVFSAFTDEFGREPFVTDGSANGTKMLANIASSGVNSNPTDFTYFKGRVFFWAFSPVAGNEVWVTDGTEAGTHMLANIASGGQSSNPVDLTVAGSYLYFAARDTTNGQELWRTDGSVAGTKRVTQIGPGNANADITQIEALGTKVIFDANTDADGIEPWVSDGTAAGTKMLPVNPTPDGGKKDSKPKGFTASGNTVYFSANDGTHGVELWSTRGSIASTHLVKDINTDPVDIGELGSGDSAPDQFFAYDGGVLFRARTTTSGFELWKSDSTEANTEMVKEINASTASSLGTDIAFTAFKGWIYFAANNGVDNYEMWRTQGTSETTELFKEIEPGAAKGDPFGFTVVGPEMTFTAKTAATGYEVFKTNGTPEGTGLLKEVRAGNPAGATFPHVVTATYNTVFYGANDGVNGDELWAYTSVGSVTTKDTTKKVWSVATANAQEIRIPVKVTAPGLNPIGVVLLVTKGKAIGGSELYAGKASVRIQQKIPKGTYTMKFVYLGSVKARYSESAPFTVTVK